MSGRPDRAAVERWFAACGRTVLPFQREAWRASLAGESGLIHAPTGSGKTLAAWIGPLLAANAADAAASVAGPRVLWITPLRALASDLVLGLREAAQSLGIEWRIEQRTGDTSSSARARQRERPPEALVTTPESLSVLMSHAETHEQLRAVQTVVVDEWHELLGSKRGVLLELALARLRTLNSRLAIWGLSATLPNLEAALRVLLGPGRTGRLIGDGVRREIVVESILPNDVLRFPWAGHLGASLVGRVAAALDGVRSALIFVNTRSQAEIWFRELLLARPDWVTTTALHHGSIDRRLRTRVEDGLRDGTLRRVVCTSSLDLGVDFAPVERVVQIGSPKGIARLIQRAGRSGHRPGEISRIFCVPTHALELLEIAAARSAVADARLEPREPLRRSLDVLVQHVVTLAAGPGFDADALLAEVRSTHAFAEMRDDEWRWLVDFVTRGGTALQGYPQFRRVSRDGGVFRIVDRAIARRHRLSIGTIASDPTLRVKWATGGDLGTIDESFIARLRPRDDFVFAGRTLTLVGVRDMTVYVKRSRATRSTVPRWLGTRLAISDELAAGVLGILGGTDSAALASPEVRAALPLIDLQARWSALPSASRLVIERMTSRDGEHLFVYAFAGRLANEGLGLLVASRLARERPVTVTVTANDYGFELLARAPLPDDERTLRRLLGAQDLVADLLASVNLAESARRAFRDIARIAGLVLPGMPGQGRSARQLQASSGLVYEVLERYDPLNPLLGQARDEVLRAQLEYRRLAALLERLAAREFAIVRLARLSPLAFPLWAARLQTQTLSSETRQARIERAAAQLERAASREERVA